MQQLSLKQKSVNAQATLFNSMLALAVFLIPFNGIVSHNALGEFQGEAAFFIFLPLLGCAMPFIQVTGSIMRYLLIAMISAIIIAFMWNANDIFEATLRGRSGINKFITSFITVIFMTFFGMMIEQRLRGKGVLVDYIFKPVIYSTMFLLAMAAFQMSTWYSGAANTLYSAVLSVLRPRYDEQIQFGRLDTVSFEPSVFSLFLVFSLVMMFGMTPLLQPRFRKFVKYFVIPATIAVVFISNARTGMISFTFVLIFQLFYMGVLRLKRPNLLATYMPAIVFLIIHILVFMYDKQLLQAILGDITVSNISRFAAIITSFEIYKLNPIFGVGLGQYAFNAHPLMPHWAWWSPEVVGQFLNPYPSWPPNHSLPLRLASELGTMGLFAYYGVLCIFFKMLMTKIWAEKARTGRYPYIGHTLILSQVFILFSGIAFDSFRLFTVWIFIATIAAYLRYDKPESLLGGIDDEDEKPVKDKATA